ncbi:MAG: isoprenylcysteine carboxylmethyltransferase family protein [Deltaproteobacteria bacterium]|nr:isoprenylcysteine carboxylmethyltransferase family protein [Deltaproteobacteria bacterium]
MTASPSNGRALFERRVELACLIAAVGFVFYLLLPRHTASLLLDAAGAPEALPSVYLTLALWNLLAGMLRIWAGGTLGAQRMMSVTVRTDRLITSGPYAHVRNPIYTADIMTLAGMALVVPWPGTVAMVLLLALVYPRVIAYEEKNLAASLGEAYGDYRYHVPRLGWRVSAYGAGSARGVRWAEGVANNFLYLPIVPGFVVCAWTGVLWHGVAVGAIGPVAWVALHFWRNYRRGGLARPRPPSND